MRIEYVALAEIRRWPRNAKLHDLDAIGRSFDRFGYVSPMIRDEGSGQLVAGHGRLDELLRKKAAGESPPARVLATRDGEWHAPVVCGASFDSPEDAEAYVVADNRLVELADAGEERRYASGWSDAAFRALEARVAEPTAPGEFAGYDVDIATNRKCPRCNFEWQENQRKGKPVGDARGGEAGDRRGGREDRAPPRVEGGARGGRRSGAGAARAAGARPRA